MECVADFPTQVFRREENAYRTIALNHLEKRIPNDIHVIFHADHGCLHAVGGKFCGMV